MQMRMNFERRMLAINALLFLAIATMAMVLLFEDRAIPAPPPVSEVAELMRQQHERVTSGESVAPTVDQYPAFGRAPMFETLIPRPTPEPTPLPTPKPDPDLKEAIKHWKVQGVASGVIFMIDERTREEWMVDLDREEERTREVTFQGERMAVRIGEVDEIYLKVTFQYRGKQGLQMVQKGMFDEPGDQ